MDDVYGVHVGTVADVYFDAEDRQVHWLQVRLGGPEDRLTAVPVHYSIASPAHVWVPIARELIEAAPEVPAGEPLARDEELALCAHYGGLRRRIVALNQRPAASETSVPAGAEVRFRQPPGA